MNPAEIAALGPLVEADGDVGAFNPDGTVNVAIIRPCTSRGRRLNGLPPIYTQEMLAEEADAFTDWRMFMGHLTPEMARAMKKAGRSIEELGGRVTESWWNPDYVTEADAAFGFERGAVMGRVIPYPAVRALLEADPKALAVSINAWPKGAKPGTDSRGRQGMVIEGFRREPQGSVDWVISAGAGGGVAEEERAVSLLESIYDPANAPGGTVKLSEMTEDEFRAHVAEHAPHLVDALAESGDGNGDGKSGLDETTVQQMLAIVEERWQERQDELVEERAATLVAEREKQRDFADHAKGRIEKAEGLTDGHRADLLKRYSVADGKPAAGLLVESEADLDTAIDADVQHAIDLIQESRPKPRVNGLGTGDAEEESGKGKSSERGWTSHLQEMGAMPLDADGKPDKTRLLDGTVN